MLFCVLGIIVPNVSEDHRTFIFSVMLLFGLFDTDAKGSVIVSNGRNYNADTLSHPRRLESSATLL
jgi:hypothetical protein